VTGEFSREEARGEIVRTRRDWRSTFEHRTRSVDEVPSVQFEPPVDLDDENRPLLSQCH
jgi:hypothetical protein